MNSDQKQTSFTIDDLQRQEAATKDNAQPRPQPPVYIRHPKLAPMGSVGIRLDRMPPPEQAREPVESKRPSLEREIGKPSNVHREFKGLASPDSSLHHSRSR